MQQKLHHQNNLQMSENTCMELRWWFLTTDSAVRSLDILSVGLNDHIASQEGWSNLLIMENK